MKLFHLTFLAVLWLLIISNSFADVKVEISNIHGGSFKAKFKTQSEADAWIADNISNDSWGKKERWEIYGEQTTCLEIRDVMNEDTDPPIVSHQECKMPVEYAIVQTDITQEETDKKNKQLACNDLITKLETEDLKLDELNSLERCKRGL